jgi:hypothetical protein
VQEIYDHLVTALNIPTRAFAQFSKSTPPSAVQIYNMHAQVSLLSFFSSLRQTCFFIDLLPAWFPSQSAKDMFSKVQKMRTRVDNGTATLAEVKNITTLAKKLSKVCLLSFFASCRSSALIMSWVHSQGTVRSAEKQLKELGVPPLFLQLQIATALGFSDDHDTIESKSSSLSASSSASPSSSAYSDLQSSFNPFTVTHLYGPALPVWISRMVTEQEGSSPREIYKFVCSSLHIVLVMIFFFSSSLSVTVTHDFLFPLDACLASTRPKRYDQATQ